jgi:hypothetical protein
MMMVAPVSIRVAVVAPRGVAPIIVAVRSVIAPRIGAAIRMAVMMVPVMAPAHDDHRGGSNDNRRRDAETDVDLDPSLSGLRGHKQYESQERNHTPHA